MSYYTDFIYGKLVIEIVIEVDNWMRNIYYVVVVKLLCYQRVVLLNKMIYGMKYKLLCALFWSHSQPKSIVSHYSTTTF